MVFFGWYSATLVHATTVVLSPHGIARDFLDGNRPLWYILLRYSATTVGNVWYILYFVFCIFWVTPTCVWCCDANTFTEHENQQTSNLNMKCVVCVCVFIKLHLTVCVFSSHLFWTSNSLEVPTGVTQGFLIHLPSVVRAYIFLARRIQPFLSLVDREVEFVH